MYSWFCKRKGELHDVLMVADIVLDAFWGDAGKGKISAYLCKKFDYDITARAGTGTNSGHSIYLDTNNIIKMRQLPCGWLNKKTRLRVGSGVVVDPEVLFDEIKQYNLEGRVKIDYRCGIITPEYKEIARKDDHLVRVIGCVGSGTGYTRSQYILRKAKQARDLPELANYTADVAKEVNVACDDGKKVLIEGGQATFLSLALSPDYPYVTSDNCTTAALADDIGLNWKNIGEVIMLVKAIPSRLGEGPLPFEISKEEILKRGIDEYGTVTGRFRRKASQMGWDRLAYATMLNGPTKIGLTYCDHYDKNITGATNIKQITPKVWDLIEKVEKVCKVPVTIVETGKLFDNIIYLEDRV